MKNVHILSTDKASRLIQAEDDELMLLNELYENTHNINKHIYITSDEEIKEGDWVVYNELEIVKCTYSKNGEFLFSEPLTSSSNHHFSYFKKIILTTDQDLIKDGVQAIDDEFLEWFVKNPSCEEVEIRKEYITPLGDIVETCYDNERLNYKIIIPKEEPKQETLEEITEQIQKDCHKFVESIISKVTYQDATNTFLFMKLAELTLKLKKYE